MLLANEMKVELIKHFKIAKAGVCEGMFIKWLVHWFVISCHFLYAWNFYFLSYFFFYEKKPSMLVYRMVCCSHQSDLGINLCMLHQSDCHIWVCISHQSDCYIRVCILHQSYHSIWISCTNHSIWLLFSCKWWHGSQGYA